MPNEDIELLETPKAQSALLITAKATKVEINLWDGIWLNPKYCNNGQSAAKPAKEGSTTRPREGRTPQAIGGGSGVA